MIIRKEKNGGLQVYDDGAPVKGLNDEELQSMKDFYSELLVVIKEKKNCLPNAKYTSTGVNAMDTVEGVGFFYDDGIKYGSYYCPNGKSMHGFTEKEIEELHNRLLQTNATTVKKSFLEEMREKLKVLGSKKK